VERDNHPPFKTDAEVDKIAFTEIDDFFKEEIANVSSVVDKIQKVVRKKQEAIAKRDARYQKITHTKTQLIAELSDFIKKETIGNFPQLILRKKEFRSYSIAQIIIHERGQQEVVSYHSAPGQQSTKLHFSVASFNNIFNVVKKSKNKLFNQSQVFPENTAILGSFLAKEFELSGHRIIFIMSRNDFIPTDYEEQKYFTDFSATLRHFFNILLLQERKIARGRRMVRSSKWVTSILEKQQQENTTPDILHFQRITLLGDLLNTLKHELSNPLFGLKLMADVMQEEAEDVEACDALKDIVGACDRCHDIIKNFSIIYKDSNETEEVDLEKLIKEVMTLTKSETRGIAKKFIIQNEIKVALVRTNITWITQILFNMILNSAQAIKNHTNDLINHLISVEVAIPTNSKDLQISVSDTGPGIDQEIIDRVFEPFFTTKPTGSGLGLTICKSLAAKLNSKIVCRNNYPARGATFSIKLRPERYKIVEN